MSVIKLRGSVLVALVLLASGCAFESPVAGSDLCFSDSDCLQNRVCSGAGRCVVSGQARADAGGDAKPDGDTPDTGIVDLPPACDDQDGDGFGVGPGCPEQAVDCNDADDQAYPSAPQRCNGQDNDCDGEIDTDNCECTPGYMRPCGTDVGACAPGTQQCEDGRWGACVGGIEPGVEICDGVDNNCDGTQDEGCPCQTNQTKPCGSNIGVCREGVQTCEAGRWSFCVGGMLASEEVCDGRDNDCDGVDDNNVVDGGSACSTGELGVCSLGSQVCQVGSLVCVAALQPRAEICNNLDDDCDGTVDGFTRVCMSTCGPGTEICQIGMFQMCTPDTSPTEICDGVDNDCDGDTDESFPEQGMTCDTGLGGRCGPGVKICNADGTLGCEPTASIGSEVCDGVDNDCDGVVDEASDGTALAEECGGTCPSRSVRICEDGAWSACDHGEAEVCNGQDSNCDSVADNQAVCYVVCGAELVPGTLTCSTSPACRLPEEICGDGIDNNCDGLIDQGCNDVLDNMLFVPGGTFYMGGATGDAQAGQNESPLHVVELAPFYIDTYEVTRSAYTRCVLNQGCSLLDFSCPLQPAITQGDKPIVCVSHSQAAAYCSWAKKRLPTEAEWEKAARGPFPRQVRWPWGDNDDASKGVFNCGSSTGSCVGDVDSHTQGRSYYGNHHMAGHAGEWTQDFYDAGFYTSAYTVDPLQTIDHGNGRTVRGGSYRVSTSASRVSTRAFSVADEQVGFRCARDVP